jgi:ankyrin repeat protein
MADINAAGIDGNSPLINAGRNGHASIIEFLISNNASLLKQDNFGGTLLHHAVEKGHIKVLETLITLGADIYSAIEIADNAGRTPLFEAVENLNDNDIEF